MKNLSWAVLGLLLCVPFTGAETIDSVSFNPARLGRYETLKVSDQLTTKGGIEANAVTVQSGGTVPTGGSLTLGENAIPEPTQSCSNLRWVERTTDDNYKYKVLAFGSCAGGDDDCKESYGPWITFTGSKTDTCNGSTTTRYTCGTTKKNCVDVYMTELTSTPIYGTPTIASSSARDTCDGNTADKYTCTSTKTSCTDVFSDVSGTIGSAYYLPSATVCRATCTAGGYTDNSATGGLVPKIL